MASKTSLFDLPNELFPCIFQYLSAIDLLKIFSDFESRRLQALIQPFIARLDISQESNEWIQNYLPNILTKNKIIALRLQMNHLVLISEHLLSTNIQSMQVTNWNVSIDFSEQIMAQLRRNLQKLSIVQPDDNEFSDLTSLLFRSDSQLKHLIIKDCVLYIFNGDIETCTRLTHLSIELEGMNPVFILIEHLPNLEELKVRIHSQECIVQTAPNTNGVKPCNKLRSVTFTGWIKYFNHMENFFATFGSTIEYLSMNIDSRYYLFDGKQLEHRLLDKMPRLSSLDLIIFSPLVGNDPIEIETFQSFAWQQFNPIAYWNDVHAKQHMIFTLPYKSDQFEYFSNDFVSNCVSNRSISICFERVRMLSLIPTTPLTLEAFLFIEKVFPNVTTINLTHWIIDLLDESEDEKDRNLTVMDEDLLLDTSLQIRSVTKFCISLWSPFNDYKTFRRFVQLFPNLICLELDIELSLLHDILKHEQEDKFVKTLLARIEQLNITWLIFYHSMGCMPSRTASRVDNVADNPVMRHQHITTGGKFSNGRERNDLEATEGERIEMYSAFINGTRPDEIIQKPWRYDPSRPDQEPRPSNDESVDNDLWDDDHIYSDEERANFMYITLSKMCDLVLHIDSVCSQPLSLLRIETNRSITMSQRQAASLLACAFFCLFPNRSHQTLSKEYENYQDPNFETLFQHGPQSKIEKLKCILHYFRRVTETMPNGVITIQRFALSRSRFPQWPDLNTGLCDLHLTTGKKIEDINSVLQVDFANKYIGGGVLSAGCVQEEIRFTICPEMLVSLLVCEMMQKNECIFLIGCERYSSYKGYANSFQFGGNYEDKTPRDSWGRRWCHVVAMDAIYFRRPSDQYNIKLIERELLKAYTSFRPLGKGSDYEFGIATGNWGCGAFNGDRQLKAIIQLMAASEARRPLIYAAYGDKNLITSFSVLHDYLKEQGATPFKYDPSNPEREPSTSCVQNRSVDQLDSDPVFMPYSSYNLTPPPLLRTGTNRSVTMSQRQAASLLACAFFCLYPNRSDNKQKKGYRNFPNPNFNALYQSGHPKKIEKLKCIFHYFQRITEKMPNGVITVQRFALPKHLSPQWADFTTGLCNLHLTTGQKIEDINNVLQVDFANKYIGGGVLSTGCVQEEIRFSICPEMLVSLLVCEKMEVNECIFLIGCERYSSYKGYANSFQFDGDYKDNTPKDDWGRKWCHLVAMDAIFFRHASTQYDMHCADRELLKAYTSFRPLEQGLDYEFAIATGNWGCGAFNGDKYVKAIIQLMAASKARRPLIYAAYRDKTLVHSFGVVYEYLKAHNATVGGLYLCLEQYFTQVDRGSLFEYILNIPVSFLKS
ncbi:unnamed protein product [Rotaria sp. Silwood1]|nr:unnamed protein product [Rotaria sp. Silwood1]CAF0942610.1 unnamed protein product [Rotaria sp. Silwood1]